MKGAALALGVCAALATAATVAAEPPQREAAESVGPVPLTHKIQVKTRPCDEGSDASDEEEQDEAQDLEPGLNASWSGKNALRLQGVLFHSGSERLAAADVSAWQVGDRIVVAYRLKSDPFPEAPSLLCPGFTHIDIRFPPLRSRPRAITVYAGRLQYTDEPDQVAVPET